MVERQSGSVQGSNATLVDSGRVEHKGGCASSRGRRRLSGIALVEFEVRLELAEAIPVRDRLESNISGGRSEGGDDRGHK